MATSEMKNTPPLYGWVIAGAAGAVASAISFLVVGIEGNGSVLIGGVVALVVGIVFTIAETPAKPAKGPEALRAPSPSVAAPEITPVVTSAPAAAAPAPAEAAPAVMAEAMPEAAVEDGTKPEMLSGPVGAADDLKQISGVGPVLEGKLNDLGVYHFWQIARWNDAEVAWVDGFLNFKGRIGRDDWIGQAKTLAETSPSKPPA